MSQKFIEQTSLRKTLCSVKSRLIGAIIFVNIVATGPKT